MRLLFWTGYRFEKWNGATETGLGGTETAVIEITKGLTKYGYEVVVAGELYNSNDKIDGVSWYYIDDFIKEFKDKPSDYFDAVIGINYIHFLEYMKDAGLDPKYKAFWMHNTDYEPYYKFELLDDYNKIWNEIQTIITPSNWSAQKILNTCIADVVKETRLDWKGIVQSCPNGIDPERHNFNVTKDPNKFIWTSAVDRGLIELLENWHKIKAVKPEATLDIYYPRYADPRGPKKSWNNYRGVLDLMEKLKPLGVSDMGSVSQDELYAAMAKATYWLYLTHYEETFCTTALEMQMSNVLCITSDVAALDFVVESGIKIPKASYETMFNQAVQIIDKLDPGLKNKALKEAKERAKLFTWSNAVDAWNETIKFNFDLGFDVKHKELVANEN